MLPRLPSLACSLVMMVGLLLRPSPLNAQCNPQIIPGSVDVADDSNPPNFPGISAVGASGNWTASLSSWGQSTITMTPGAVGSWQLTAGSTGYFLRSAGTITCILVDVGGTPCSQCTGSYSALLYGTQGSLQGNAVLLPQGIPWVPQQPFVFANPIGCADGPAATVNPSAYFNFGGGPNNWALTVTSADGGRESQLYYLSLGDTCQTATTFSSERPSVTLTASTVSEEPDMRCEKPEENSSSIAPPDPTPVCAPCAVGRPINVTSGNVHLDQTDARVPGVATELRFTRSFNSKTTASSSQYGAFGPGWNHSYEKRLVVTPNLILLRQANGVPAYFQDSDANQTYLASLPFSKASWFVRQPDGSYFRYFRKGGRETYNPNGRLMTIEDALGNQTTLGYDGSGRRPNGTRGLRNLPGQDQEGG